jgi:transposase
MRLVSNPSFARTPVDSGIFPAQTALPAAPARIGVAERVYSRDQRSDCRQVVIALVVTTDGLPLAYEVMAGNTADKTTLKGFLDLIQKLYGKARRVWVMDRGIPTEATLEQMRRDEVAYLVETPKHLLTRMEQSLADQPWEQVHEQMDGRSAAMRCCGVWRC